MNLTAKWKKNVKESERTFEMILINPMYLAEIFA